MCKVLMKRRVLHLIEKERKESCIKTQIFARETYVRYEAFINIL